MAITELKQRDMDCIHLLDLMADEYWPIVEKLINESINDAKDKVLNAKGEIADYDRGGGQYLKDLLTKFQDMTIIGQKLLQSRSDQNKE